MKQTNVINHIGKKINPNQNEQLPINKAASANIHPDL